MVMEILHTQKKPRVDDTRYIIKQFEMVSFQLVLD